jgi:hypothetical protein
MAGVTIEKGKIYSRLILGLQDFLEPIGVCRGQGTQVRVAEPDGDGHASFFAPGLDGNGALSPVQVHLQHLPPVLGEDGLPGIAQGGTQPRCRDRPR